MYKKIAIFCAYAAFAGMAGHFARDFDPVDTYNKLQTVATVADMTGSVPTPGIWSVLGLYVAVAYGVMYYKLPAVRDYLFESYNCVRVTAIDTNLRAGLLALFAPLTLPLAVLTRRATSNERKKKSDKLTASYEEALATLRRTRDALLVASDELVWECNWDATASKWSIQFGDSGHHNGVYYTTPQGDEFPTCTRFSGKLPLLLKTFSGIVTTGLKQRAALHSEVSELKQSLKLSIAAQDKTTGELTKILEG